MVSTRHQSTHHETDGVVRVCTDVQTSQKATKQCRGRRSVSAQRENSSTSGARARRPRSSTEERIETTKKATESNAADHRKSPTQGAEKSGTKLSRQRSALSNEAEPKDGTKATIRTIDVEKNERAPHETEAPSERLRKRRKKSGRPLADPASLELGSLASGAVSTFFAPARKVRRKSGSSASSGGDIVMPIAEDESRLRSIVASLPERFALDKAALRQSQESRFGLWWAQWQLGYSLLFYGVGSKRSILNDFAREWVRDGPCLAVLGADPKVTARNTLARVLALVAPSDQYGSLSTQAMIDALRTSDTKLYVLIHNIDGMGLRNMESQRLLSEMASLPNVHVAASIDHVNAPLLWDVQTRDRFSWVWHAVHTYQPYITEVAVAALPSVLTTKSESATFESALVVLSSLSSTAREVFKIVIDAQLEGNEDEGIDPQRLFRTCRDRFLVSNQGLLQAILTEYRDHHLLATKRGHDGREILYVPLEGPSLCQIVENINGATT